jgi:small ligand-binding sensory domain FIST
MTNRFAAALSAHPVAPDAAGEVIGEVLEALGPAPDLAVLFATAAHLDALDDVAAVVQTMLDPVAFFGAGAVAVLAGERGVEDEPGLALWAARLAGSGRGPVVPVHLTVEQTEDGWTLHGWPAAAAQAARSLVLVADPFTFPVSEVLHSLHRQQPALSVVGGLASAARGPGENRLIVGGRVARTGAVGVLLPADVAPRTVVSQGCRPIGRPLVVTKAERNLLLELAGRPALERLVETIEELPTEERELVASGGLHCGIVIDESKLDFERGDFLIRGVVGADRSSGAVAVGEAVPVGATVQFQVRDASTAAEDLGALLHGVEAHAALVFTCNGRGTAMFGDASHDARLIHDVVGRAVAGMFCAGELGPVAGHNEVHGFTASIALFD